MAVRIEPRPAGVRLGPALPGASVRRAGGPIAMVAATASWGLGTAVNKLTLERVHLRPMTQQAIELSASIGLLAALVVVSTSGAGTGASGSGDALLVGSVVCAAGYVMLSSRGAGTVAPLVATLTQQCGRCSWSSPCSPRRWWSSVSVRCRSGGPGCSCWRLASSATSSRSRSISPPLESLPATLAAQYLALIPLCGLVGAAVVLGERLPATALAGGAAVVVALFRLSRTSGHEKRHVDT